MIMDGMDVPRLNDWFPEPLYVYAFMYTVEENIWSAFLAIHRNDLANEGPARMELIILKRTSRDSYLFTTIDENGVDLRKAIGNHVHNLSDYVVQTTISRPQRSIQEVNPSNRSYDNT